MQPNLKLHKTDSIIIENDIVTLKTILFLRYDIKVLRFDKKSIFNAVLGFSPYWDYKIYIGYDNDYYSEKFRNSNTTNKIPLKCDCVDGGVSNCLRQPILYSFFSDKPAGYKIGSETESVHYEKK